MKRSFINTRIEEGIAFCNRNKFHLPRWAYWTAKDWSAAGHEADEIRRCMLGWDMTDFGSNDYARCGLLLFTIRNGKPGAQTDKSGKDYCEKLLLVDDEQVTPTHFHWYKMEDIINRGGGELVMELWTADPKTEAIDRSRGVRISIDGIERTFAAGEKVVLSPGESITLPPFMYHRFYAAKGKGMVLGGEVSRVNDDANDNRFLEKLPRFSAIEEDAAPVHLLCNEYPPARG